METAELKKKRVDEVEVADTLIKYEVGTIVDSPFHGEPKMVLKERLESYPTNAQWASIRWRVRFLDRYNKEDQLDCYRAITEVGNPNTNIPGPIPGLDFKGEEPEGEAMKVEIPLIKNNKLNKNKIKDIINKGSKIKKK